MTEISFNDIERLAAEVNHISPEEWMERTGVSFETIQKMVDVAQRVFTLKILTGGDEIQSIGETLANIFMIGWNAGEQFGNHTRIDGK